MQKDLEKSQAKLDKIQEKLIENKQKRLAAGGGSDELRAEAVRLRDEYIAEEKIREALLKEVLTKGVK